jgi:hypothetical protein
VKTWRSWPWTIALAAVLAGFALLGVVGLGLRTSAVEIVVSLVVTAAAVAGLLRVLSMGVRATPTGLIIRDLTRTTRVPWTSVRRITCEPGGRRGVHVPVLRLGAPPAVKGGRRGTGTGTGKDIEITVLGSYQRAVAQRRADQIEAARVGVARTR